MDKFFGTGTANVELFFNIFSSVGPTFVTCVVEVCRLGLEPLCGNHLRLSVILKTLTLTRQEFLEV